MRKTKIICTLGPAVDSPDIPPLGWVIEFERTSKENAKK